MKKNIQNGISDFKTLIENNYYYIDKTNFINEIGKNVGQTLLFTRPRRFGKTINMSMLNYFFNIKGKEENRKLFKGLNIEKSPYFEKQGKYPVIFISFKDVKEECWEKCLKNIKEVLKELFSDNLFIREKLNIIEQRDFDKIAFMEEDANFKESIKYLSKFLYKYYGEKVIILIDEYDTPLVSAYQHGYYNEALNFFRGLYSSALKDNVNLQIGVMTGIIKVVKAGIFSDLNNLSIHTILDKDYDEYFGLLENEVKELLKYYGKGEKTEDVKEWYNGYLFGDVKVYNPWSILNFVSKGILKSYWIDTSENYLIKNILINGDNSTFSKLNRLLRGEIVEEEITGKTTLQEVLGQHDIWELLLFSGYLTVEKETEENIYSLKIPNKEVKDFFKDSFIDTAFGGRSLFRNMINNLKENRIEDFEKNLQEIMIKHMSFNDVSNLEKVYHSFILGLMIYLEGEYNINSNQESGLGRYDISIEPLNKNKTGFIFEFKTADKEKDLEEKAKEGLKQIEDKKYYISLEKKGIKNIVFAGVAFYKKLLKLRYKINNFYEG